MNYKQITQMFWPRQIGTIGDVIKHTMLSKLFMRARQLDRPISFMDFNATLAHDTTMLDQCLPPNCFHKMFATFGIDPSGKRFNNEHYSEIFDPYIRAIRRYNQPDVQEYMARVQAVVKDHKAGNTEAQLDVPLPRHYPGSVLFAKHWMRPQDNAVIAQNNEVTRYLLQQHLAHDRRFRVYDMPSRESILAAMPTRTHFGIGFHDIPFHEEDHEEYWENALLDGLSRMPYATHMIYYPATDYPFQWIYNMLREAGFTSILGIEVDLGKQVENVENDTVVHGVAIANPPEYFDLEAEQLMETILQFFLPWYRPPVFPHENTIMTDPVRYHPLEERYLDRVWNYDEMMRCVNVFWVTDPPNNQKHTHQTDKRSWTLYHPSQQLIRQEAAVKQRASAAQFARRALPFVKRQEAGTKEAMQLAGLPVEEGRVPFEGAIDLETPHDPAMIPIVQGAIKKLQLPVSSKVSFEPYLLEDSDFVNMQLGRAYMQAVRAFDPKRPSVTKSVKLEQQNATGDYFTTATPQQLQKRQDVRELLRQQKQLAKQQKKK